MSVDIETTENPEEPEPEPEKEKRIDFTKNFWRVRVRNPKKFVESSYRTIPNPKSTWIIPVINSVLKSQRIKRIEAKDLRVRVAKTKLTSKRYWIQSVLVPVVMSSKTAIRITNKIVQKLER